MTFYGVRLRRALLRGAMALVVFVFIALCERALRRGAALAVGD